MPRYPPIKPLNFNTCISACSQDSNEISTALPMFSGSRYQMRIVATLSYQAGINRKWKSKMVTCKCEMLISQLVHKIARNYQRLYPCFRSQATQRDKWKYCAKSGCVVNQIWRPLTGSRYDIMYISAFIHNETPTAIPMFSGVGPHD